MRKKRYILVLSLIERDELEQRDPRTLATAMFYRTHSEGEARLDFDNVLGILKQESYCLEDDSISWEAKHGAKR